MFLSPQCTVGRQNKLHPISTKPKIMSNNELQAGLDPITENHYIYENKDCKQLINDYTTQIKEELIEENQMLQEKNTFLQEKAKSSETKNFTTINSKLDILRKKLQENAQNLELQFVKSTQESQIKINDIIQQEKKINTSIANFDLKNSLPELVAALQQEQKEYEESKQISVLLEENSSLQLLVIKEFSESNKIKVCSRCKQKFSPLENTEVNSCQYHPGSLKYYSCLGCGGDEYYSCCMKCNTCSKGCRHDKHVAQE